MRSCSERSFASRHLPLHSAFRTPHSALAGWGTVSQPADDPRRRATARLRSQRHHQPRSRRRDRGAPARGARAGARPRWPHGHAPGRGPGRARGALARRRAGAAPRGHDVGRARGHGPARRVAPRLPGVAGDWRAAGGHGLRGRRARQRAGRTRGQLRSAAARGRGAGRGGVRAVRAARAERAGRGREPGHAPGDDAAVARSRGVRGKLRPLRAQGARGGAARRVGLLRRRALRARAGLAPGHPEPHRHAVWEARALERHVGRDAQLFRRRQQDLPSGQPAPEPRRPPARLELHPRRLFRAPGAPRDLQRAAPARAGRDPARRQRVRTVPQQCTVQRQLRGCGLAPVEPHADRGRCRAALRPAAPGRPRAALAGGRGRGLPAHGGAFVGGNIEVVPRLTATLAARYDWIRVPFEDLVDLAGSGLNMYRRLSPRAGLTWSGGRGHEVFASLSRGFRAPALVEIGCADPQAACPLPFALGPDPALQPVVATTYELGWRYHAPSPRTGLDVSANVYRTDVRDDIFFVASSVTGGYFQNVGATRRGGLELALQWIGPAELRAYLNYGYTTATFQTTATLATTRDPAGETVTPGAALPMVPNHRANAGVSLPVVTWSGGATLRAALDARYVGRQWLRGDEANATRRLSDYAVADASVTLSWRERELRAMVRNVFDRRYFTFGTFAENPTAPGNPVERWLTPGVPRSVQVSLSTDF